MSESRIYARNLAANWTAHGANMVVLFFLSPFIVHTLGKVEYGIWGLLSVLTGYMGIFDLGIRASTGRHIILYLGREDHDSVDETIRTGLGFFSAIGLLILAMGFALGWLFPSFFASVPRSYHGLVRLLLPILALNVWLTAFRAVFSSVLTAHDRFDLARGVDLVMLTIQTVGTILVLNWGYGILGLALVVIACNLVGLAGNWLLALRIYPRLKVWPLAFSRKRLRELFGYGLAAFISAIAVKIIGQTDLIVVGTAIDVSAVTVYSVGAMLIYYSSTFIGLIATTLFPPVQRAVARGEMGAARWLFFRQVRLALILGIPMYVGFIVFARPFIRLWMFGPKFGEAAVEKAAVVMCILAGSKLLYLFTLGSSSLLAALGHIRFNAAIVATEAVFNLGLSLFFVLGLGWGLAGVAAGTLISRLLVTTFAVPWNACRKAGLSWRSFLVRIGGTGVASAAAFACWCVLVSRLLSGDSWLKFWAQVGIALIGYAPIAVCVLLPESDRQRIWACLKSRPRPQEGQGE